jgi:hypothetical protein
MKPRTFLIYPAGMLVLAVTALSADSASTKPRTASPAKSTSAPPAVAPVEIPRSVFVVASKPSEGRNPFFPQSAVKPVEPPPKAIVIQKPVQTDPFASLVLNGITSPPKPTAMVNGRIFEPGETAEIKLPGGAKVLLRCEEIKTDSAVFRAGDQRRELRLHSRSGPAPATVASRSDK